MRQLTAIIDETFSSQPIAHWREVLDKAHVPYGLVRDPNDVVNDPQLQANNIVVPLEGAGENLKLTISSPIQVHGVAKVAAKRAPDLGEHSEEILQELGFDAKQVDDFFASKTVSGRREEPAMGGVR
jgi:formyl-CoA transferase